MSQNKSILQDAISLEQREMAAGALPGMRPVAGSWLVRDAAYDAQIAEKARLLALQRDDVLRVQRGADAACQEALACICAELRVTADRAMIDDPLAAIAGLVQEDICILQKQGDRHVLTAALLCFPASWTLTQKIGKPLDLIHGPVVAYDPNIAQRVERLFDGVRVGQPLWRANLLNYDDAELYQPRTEADPRPVGGADSPFERSERQTILRLPQSRAVVFAIHTSVVRRD